MAKFVYLGDHPKTSLFGFDFFKGQPTEVTGDKFIAKLRGNFHFSEVFDDVEVLAPADFPASEFVDEVSTGADLAPVARKPGRPRKAE